MRVLLRLLVCASVAAAAAGCSNSDRHYFKEGVGANLYAESAIAFSDDANSRTELQRQYVDDICQQAGLLTGECGPGVTSPRVWRAFVQAGMNDIDQRCDAYLVWLDNVRRAQAPTLKQLADTQTATTIIMREAGLGVAPITIAAAAFGLAIDTFTNVTARLVLEVDRSTVQTLVLNRQRRYREDLFGSVSTRSAISIESRPAAIFALRSYLRICMPMTIETEINTTIATFERGGADALSRGTPMISAQTVSVATISDPMAPTPRGPVAPPPLAGDTRFGRIEQAIPPETIKAYQRALCVSPADGLLGSKESVTRAAISEYLRTIRETDASREFDARTQAVLQRATRRVGDCRASNYRNAFEVGKFGVADDTTLAIQGMQRDLAAALKKKGIDTPLPVTGQFGPDANAQDPTRTAIAQFRLLSLAPNVPPGAADIRDPQNRQLNDAVNRAIILSR